MNYYILFLIKIAIYNKIKIKDNNIISIVIFQNFLYQFIFIYIFIYLNYKFIILMENIGKQSQDINQYEKFENHKKKKKKCNLKII